MMRGTKRLATSDFNPFSNNDSIENKRVLAGSAFDTQRAEPSQEQSVVASPPLDKQRAELSRQHVRALNTQFASWIQTQLDKHPDELWDDGVQDYLTHAKTIMEDFNDVVSWLKANAARSENTSTLGSDTNQKKVGSESKEKENGLLFGRPTIPPITTVSFGTPVVPPISTPVSFGTPPANATVSVGTTPANTTFSFGMPPANTTVSFGTPVVPPANTTASFGTSWSSGPLFNNSAPFSFGLQSSVIGNQNQNAAPSNDGASDNLDGEEDTEQPSSPSVKKAEEKGIVVVHEVRCKLYVRSSDPKDEDPWKHKGTGQLVIKCKEGVDKGTKESKPTIVVRNDVGKVLLNAALYPGIKTTMQKNSIFAIFHTAVRCFP
ncbi:OLC1v1029535C2 [Oldenlandia corymbosa var. corymbosa]|uniref:OLC1v1029535C2 n=1 Tax=Oldenlandia corymbosa var. corymbosa TaxID=529605 RepID=A0AAV1CE19_OLDCO|nr:OLC1v1029535C2 [Oldenlandia corymbosa var. corymbosa]